MKKALGGCLIVGVLLLVVGGGALWWFVLRPAWNAGSEYMAAATQFAEIAQLDARVENQAAYTPPADGTIPADALQRFLAVQQTLQQRVGDRLAVLETKYDELEARTKAQGVEPGLADVIGAYGDLFGLIREAKVAQVDALNAQGMSLYEYRWTRTQAYTALGMAGVDDVSEALPGGAHNAEQLRAHRELLEQTVATTWLDF